MHHFLGYSWSEIASMLGVISLIFSGFYWLVIHSGKVIDRKISQMFEPFSRKIDSLNENLGRLNNTLAKQQVNLDRLEQRVDEHDRRLDRQHERLKTLFKQSKEDKE